MPWYNSGKKTKTKLFSFATSNNNEKRIYNPNGLRGQNKRKKVCFF